MFTMQNTYREIMTKEMEPRIKTILGTMLFTDSCVTSLIPESAYDCPMQELAGVIKTPWGMPFPADEVVEAANLAQEVFNEGKWEIRGLWDPRQEVVFDNSKRSVCLFTPVMPKDEKRPPVILCPGGAYGTISMVGEGFRMARELTEKGFHPYILRYRLSPVRFPEPQKDLTLAILNVRANSAQDGIDPDNLMIAGFSAGGHLCASALTMIRDLQTQVTKELADKETGRLYGTLKAMPEKMALGYAIGSFEKDYCDCLIEMCEEEEKKTYSPAYHISADFPKTYCFACEDDPLVPSRNTVLLGEACKDAGVSCLYHIFPSGGHGIAAGRGTSAQGWIEEMLDFMG